MSEQVLIRLSRRDVLSAAGCAVGCAALSGVLGGCFGEEDGQVVETGPLGGSGEEGGGESAVGSAECSAAPMDVGPGTRFAPGTATYVDQGRFYVMRDASGLYAISAICTHKPCVINMRPTFFECPCHGARFDRDGAVLNGPAFLPLAHFAMCRLDNGNVGVDPATRTSAEDRLDA